MMMWVFILSMSDFERYIKRSKRMQELEKLLSLVKDTLARAQYEPELPLGIQELKDQVKIIDKLPPSGDL